MRLPAIDRDRPLERAGARAKIAFLAEVARLVADDVAIRRSAIEGRRAERERIPNWRPGTGVNQDRRPDTGKNAGRGPHGHRGSPGRLPVLV